jgi:hypothetical protein
MKYYWIFWSLFIFPSCINKSVKCLNYLHADTLFTEQNWFLENYIEDKKGDITYVEKKILFDSNILSLQWEEKYDEIIAKAFFNRKITFNSFVFDFDKEYYRTYKYNVSEGFGFISKDLIIRKNKGYYVFNLILCDFLCLEDCYNYEVIECKVYNNKHMPPEFRIKEYISKQGIPKI